MKKMLLAAGLLGASTLAAAQNMPTREQATVALQDAMQREIQAMNSAPESSRGNFDGQVASNVVRTLEVRSIDNCQSTGAQGVVCDVRTVADVRGSRQEKVNRYQFYQQSGKWEARLPSAS
ncbi:hypothetical protein GCM10023144_27580 [Pigmentiphaga soli]|uniref:DUF2790 domain-containing protein n=1 Tax=Pigmentiphaga soli TaxID=1007095 RepID=A0ABP8H5Z1_9BURK